MRNPLVYGLIKLFTLLFQPKFHCNLLMHKAFVTSPTSLTTVLVYSLVIWWTLWIYYILYMVKAGRDGSTTQYSVEYVWPGLLFQTTAAILSNHEGTFYGPYDP